VSPTLGVRTDGIALAPIVTGAPVPRADTRDGSSFMWRESMPRRGTSSNDTSPGDGRQPYSDIGGKEARHAQTHDVRREELTNAQPMERTDEFAEDIAPSTPSQGLHSHAAASTPAAADKALHGQLPDLTNDVLSRLAVIEPGVPLEQGSVYLDLNDRAAGPFKALGNQQADRNHRYVAKKDTDYELWNQLVGDHNEVTIERPV
jgi:hypothetical protein